jgi:hypothetical protein
MQTSSTTFKNTRGLPQAPALAQNQRHAAWLPWPVLGRCNAGAGQLIRINAQSRAPD